jgi:microcystin-dependent protein
MPYIGEIRLFAGNFAPAGWAFCDGAVIPISENDTLFTLLGTTYGGDGQETFALPNLQSRVPIHMGTGPDGTTYTIGEMAGTESETLTTQQIPVHSHQAIGTTDGASLLSPQNGVLAQASSTQAGMMSYNPPPPGVSMVASEVTPVGGSQPHENVQPFLCINFIISLFGVFPTPN